MLKSGDHEILHDRRSRARRSRARRARHVRRIRRVRVRRHVHHGGDELVHDGDDDHHPVILQEDLG